MYRNLAPSSLGLVGCRDHELIELALTYRFAGIDLDIQRFQEQVESKGMAAAKRYLQSAPLRITSADLLIDWACDDTEFGDATAKINDLVASLKELDCSFLTATLMAGSDNLPYHENFEFHRQRLGTLAEMLAQDEIKLGLTFCAAPSERGGSAHPFIHSVEALLALLKVVDSPNIVAIVDMWNWTLGGGTVDQIVDLGPDRIGDVRLADLPEGYDLETVTQEERPLPGTTGVVDSVTVLTSLSEMGYVGPITPSPHRRTFQAQSREERVGRTAKQMDQLWQQAGLMASPEIAEEPQAAGTTVT